MLYSKAFKVSTINATFNEVIERDAANGRIPSALLLAVVTDYGFDLPAKVREFIVTLNREFLAGTGKAKFVPLVQVLHQCASAIIGSGKVTNPPILLALPEWADPAAIEAKRIADKAVRAAKKEEAASAAGAAGADAAAADAGADAAAGAGAVQAVPDVAAALALVHAAIRNGALTAEQITALQDALATAPRAPVAEKTIVPAVRKSRKARESKAAQAEVDAMTA